MAIVSGGFHTHISLDDAAQAQCRSCVLRPVIDATNATETAKATECVDGEHCELHKMRPEQTTK